MHRILARQLRRSGIDPAEVPEEWRTLLEAVSASYDDADRTRYRIERALALSSEESQRRHLREQSLSAAAQALLMSESKSPEQEAIEALGFAIACETVALAKFTPEPEVVAWTGTTAPDPCTTLGLDPAVTNTLERGETVELDGGSTRTRWIVPVFVDERLAGAVCGSGVSGEQLPHPDTPLAKAVAAMIGAHWSRLEAHCRLEHLVTAKDRFVASISHELRTPLTTVLGFAHELQSRWHAFSVTEARDLLDLIVAHGEEVADLVEDLLVVARSEIGQLRLHPVDLDLREQAKLATVRLDDHDPERLTFEGHGRAFADPIRVRQIIRNMVSNAFRYGGARVRVRIVRLGATVQVEVRDDGRGIPEEAVARIFEPFESAHLDGGQPQAVGLGLWVARTLGEMMGGSIDYRREHGESVFSLELPAPTSPDVSPPRARRAGLPPGRARS